MKLLKNVLNKYRLGFTLSALTLLLFSLEFFGVVNFQELAGLDLKFHLRGEHPADSMITVVTVDDVSLATLGQWPWPRNVYGSFLKIISRYNPRAVFFDILFTEAAPDPAQDESLRSALEASGKVVLPFFYQEKPFHAIFPIEKLKNAAKAVGFANIEPDPDGKVRRITLAIRGESEVYFHPAVQISEGFNPDPKKFKAQKTSWINFPGTERSFRKISFSDAIQAAGTNQDDKLKEYFQDRYVLIGHTASGTVDLRPTPFSPLEPGIFVQASILHTVLQGKNLRDFSWYIRLLLAIFLVALTLGLIRGRKPYPGLGVALLFAAGFSILNFLVFIFLGWILPIFLPLTLILFTYGIWLLFQYVDALFQKERMLKELSIAAQIQEKFLPRPVPPQESMEAAFACKFAKTVGGDLLDWSLLKNGEFCFSIGDVSGKGVPAALFGAKCISELRHIDKENRHPHQVLQSLNEKLLEDEVSGMFLTFWFGVYNPKTGCLRFSSAGHEPCLHFRSRIKDVEVVNEGKGMPLALFSEPEYETREMFLEPGDAVLLFTDGVRELRNPNGDELGVEAIGHALRDLSVQALTGNKVITELFEKFKTHQKDIPAHDDSTLFFFRVNLGTRT